MESSAKDTVKPIKQFHLESQQVNLSINDVYAKPTIYSQNNRSLASKYSIEQQSQLLKNRWTKQQEAQAYKLHDQLGNKWALIAHKLIGRTDNSVKNLFYSKLRKTLRKLNNCIQKYFQRNYKLVEMKTIYKVMEIHEEGHKSKTKLQPEAIEFCKNLKNKLLYFSNVDELQLKNETKRIQTNQLLRQLSEFNRNFKGQIKRKRKNSQNEEYVIGKNNKRKNHITKSQNDSQEQIFQDIEMQHQKEDTQTFNHLAEMNYRQKRKRQTLITQNTKAFLAEKPVTSQNVQINEWPYEDPEQFLQQQELIQNQLSHPAIHFLNKDTTQISIFSDRYLSSEISGDLFFEDNAASFSSQIFDNY